MLVDEFNTKQRKRIVESLDNKEKLGGLYETHGIGLYCPKCGGGIQHMSGSDGDHSVGDSGHGPDVFCGDCEISFDIWVKEDESFYTWYNRVIELQLTINKSKIIDWNAIGNRLIERSTN